MNIEVIEACIGLIGAIAMIDFVVFVIMYGSGAYEKKPSFIVVSILNAIILSIAIAMLIY